MRTDALAAAIERDRADGVRPIAVCATAGTTTTGAIDPLPEIAGLAAEHGLWLHVDAAYGGAAILSDELRGLLDGIEHADSLAVDPHKWLYTSQSAGCVLVRDFGALARSFHSDASYIWLDEAARHGVDYAMHGPQFSRGFAALKVWVSLLAHGRRAYTARISHDAALARYLGARAEERPDFELATPVGLSICCFRYVPPDLPAGPDREPYLSTLNERLMTAAQLDGRTFFSNAVLDGRYVLRACIVNFRTEADDLDATLEVAAEIGARLDAELRPASLTPKPGGGA
jgi:glutamate/tyrosine decarboxylase-like PLP-dependent enzyme